MNNFLQKINFYKMNLFSAKNNHIIDAQSLNLIAANNSLKSPSIMRIKINKKKAFFSGWFAKKISTKDIAIFFQQLATLIISGIPIVQSFEILRQTQDKIALRLIITLLKHEIEAGKNFVSGLQKFPSYFDELTCHLIHMGEQTGTLDIMLKQIANYKEKSLILKKQIQQALFYPTLILLVAIVVSLILLIGIVPRFAELFDSMQGHLPAFTLLVIKFSFFIQKQYWIGCFLLMLLVLGHYYFKQSISFRNQLDCFLLKLPILNSILKKITLMRFCRNLAITFSAGVPIIDALQIVAHTCGNFTYAKAILALQTHIAKGQQLHATLQLNPLFPTLLVQMIKVGEESGTLKTILGKIAELYERDIDHFVANLSHLLEPLIMIILGVLIGGLVIAMYLPIFKLGTVI